MKGKTTTGFEFELDEEKLNDYELLEELSKIDKGNAGGITDVIQNVLGEEQKNRLKDHVRNENGKVTIDRMTEEFVEILRGDQSGKNS